MKLQEIFAHLSGAEFAQLSIGGLDAGDIDLGNRAIVVGHINLGLTALFRRFNLRTGSLVLRLQEGQGEYRLTSPYAVSAQGSAQAVRYIIDTVASPFQDDLIKVEKVVDEEGCLLSLNDASCPASLTTPSSARLVVPECVPRQDLEITYRANHPKVAGNVDPATYEVELPDTHLEALLYFVASRAHSPMGMGQTAGMASNTYFAKYEAVCQELENKGLQTDLGGSNYRLERNGWV